MTSFGVALPSMPTRLYQTTMSWARAASCMRMMFGIAATQRGRAVQPAFMMSSSSSAVVAGSTVTSLISGGGGATAVLQSEMTSATDGEPSNAAMTAPPMAAKRKGDMACSRYPGGRPSAKIEQSRHAGYGPSPAIRVRAARRADRLTLVADDRRGGVVDRGVTVSDPTMVGRGRRRQRGAENDCGGKRKFCHARHLGFSWLGRYGPPGRPLPRDRNADWRRQ